MKEAGRKEAGMKEAGMKEAGMKEAGRREACFVIGWCPWRGPDRVLAMPAPTPRPDPSG